MVPHFMKSDRANAKVIYSYTVYTAVSFDTHLWSAQRFAALLTWYSDLISYMASGL